MPTGSATPNLHSNNDYSKHSAQLLHENSHHHNSSHDDHEFITIEAEELGMGTQNQRVR